MCKHLYMYTELLLQIYSSRLEHICHAQFIGSLMVKEHLGTTIDQIRLMVDHSVHNTDPGVVAF